MKKLTVWGLEKTCGILDHFRQVGCLWGIAAKSAELDERWGTGVWKSPDA